MTTHSSPRLLVADDDLGVIAAYRLVLEKAPDHHTVKNLFGLEHLEQELFGKGAAPDPEWRITFVDQGVDAVKATQWAIDDNDPYTAIFLDIRMPPGIDGYEAAAQIRKIDPNVHIVIVTGYSDYTYDELAKVAGPENLLTYMVKPVWPDELRKVARLLAEHKSHRSAIKL